MNIIKRYHLYQLLYEDTPSKYKKEPHFVIIDEVCKNPEMVQVWDLNEEAHRLVDVKNLKEVKYKNTSIRVDITPKGLKSYVVPLRQGVTLKKTKDMPFKNNKEELGIDQ